MRTVSAGAVALLGITSRWRCGESAPAEVIGRATDTLIPVVALPLSLLLTVAVMYALNYSINNLTLMAMTLAIV